MHYQERPPGKSLVEIGIKEQVGIPPQEQSTKRGGLAQAEQMVAVAHTPAMAHVTAEF